MTTGTTLDKNQSDPFYVPFMSAGWTLRMYHRLIANEITGVIEFYPDVDSNGLADNDETLSQVPYVFRHTPAVEIIFEAVHAP